MIQAPFSNLGSRLKSLPLQIQAAAITALLFAIGIFGLSAFVVHGLEVDYEEQTGQTQIAAANYVARSINDDIKVRINALISTADHLKDLPDLSKPRLQAYIAEKPGTRTLFSRDLYIIWKDGLRIAENPNRGMVGLSYSDTPYFQEVIKDKRPVVQVIMGRAAKKPVLVVAVPIFSADGTFLGVLCGTDLIEGDSFLNLANGVRNGLAGGFHVFAQSQGIWAASTDPMRILEKVPVPGVNPLFDQRRTGYLGAGRVVDSKGLEIIAGAAIVDTPNWMVIAFLPAAEAFAPLVKARSRIYAGAFVIIALIGFLTCLYLQRALRPLENASKRLEELKTQHFAVEPLVVEGSKEIRVLLEKFNLIQAELAQKNRRPPGIE